MRNGVVLLRAGSLSVTLALLAGCASLGERARGSVYTAARDPWTLLPLAGATVIAASDSDRRLSDWAKKQTPIYGSPEAARDASDRLRLYASNTAWSVFILSPPQGDGSWPVEKVIDTAENLAALALTRNTAGSLKHATQRERPHGGPVHDSLPSAHASDAFAHATMGRHYGQTLHPGMQEGVTCLGGAFAAATAWGRVEAGVHYPTDVLVGAAIGNFVTRFVLELTSPAAGPGWRFTPVMTPAGEMMFLFGRGL